MNDAHCMLCHAVLCAVCRMQTAEVQLARRMISAELSRLPAGVVPQHINRRGKDLCDSCGEDQEVAGNHMLECDGCG